MIINQERAFEIMQQHRIDALLAATYNNVLYLADFELEAPFLFGGIAFAIFPNSKDIPPTLIVPEYALAYLAEKPSWMREIHTFGSFKFSMRDLSELEEPELSYARYLQKTEPHKIAEPRKVLLSIIKRLGLENSRLAVDDPFILASLQEQQDFAGEPIGGTEIFRDIRSVKTTEEIARLKKAAQCNESAISDALQIIEVGIHWKDVYHAWDSGMRKRGAVPRFWLSSAGARASGLFPHMDYRLSAGDIIRFECGGTYQNYWTDTGRTAVLGQPSKKLVDYYHALRTARSAIEDLLMPQASPNEIVTAAINAIRANGLASFADTAWGHGLGLDAYDLPMINIKTSKALEEGSVIAFETPYFEIGWGGIQLEDTYLLQNRGWDRLTQMEQDLLIIEA
jgi:Xaa-Pro aminopeptidase